jgi:hypothetical protein
MSGLQAAQRQVNEALHRSIDVSKLVPELEVPKLLSPGLTQVMAHATAAAHVFEQMSGLQDAQRHINEALKRSIDVSQLVPKVEIPRVLSPELTRLMAEATSATRMFNQLSGLQEAQRRINEVLRQPVGTVDPFQSLRAIPPSLLADLDRAAARLRAALPDDQIGDLLPRETVQGDDSAIPAKKPGLDSQALLLLLACVAVTATVSPGAGRVLVALLASFLENGATAVDLSLDAYRELSKLVPDDNVIAWALLLTAVVRWLRPTSHES